MKTPRFIQLLVLVIILTSQVSFGQGKKHLKTYKTTEPMENKILKSDEEWRSILTPVQYHVLREKGTESPFTGRFYLHNETGIYKCGACGNDLFRSETKFDAGCGWPSFNQPISDKSIVKKLDTSHGMIRTEVICARCESHLGHVFEDGPQPTGMRYCINSVSLGFDKTDPQENETN